MRRLVFIAIAIVFYGCSAQEKEMDRELKSLDHAISDSVLVFHQDKDSSHIINALPLCDEAIERATDNESKYQHSQKKVMLLGLLGQIRKAFCQQEKSVQYLDSNDVRSLEFYALSSLVQGNMPVAHDYYNKVIRECDAFPDNWNIVCKKSSCYLSMGKDKEARETIRKYQEKHHDAAAELVLKDFDNWAKQQKEGKDLLIQSLRNDKCNVSDKND